MFLKGGKKTIHFAESEEADKLEELKKVTAEESARSNKRRMKFQAQVKAQRDVYQNFNYHYHYYILERTPFWSTLWVAASRSEEERREETPRNSAQHQQLGEEKRD